MNHDRYREWLQLWFYNELSENEGRLLEEHLHSCDACAAERDQLRAFHQMLSHHAAAPSVDDVLRSARAELRLALVDAAEHPSWTDRLRDVVDSFWTPRVQIAFGGAFVLILGIFVGTRLAGDGPGLAGLQTASGSLPAASFDHGEAQIANLKFIDRNDAKGEVEFTFEATTPVRIAGNVNDPRIQQILARALLSDQNPGVRLRAVSTIADRPASATLTADVDIKRALISAVKFDRNAGVRQEALKALEHYLPDPEATQAFLYLLKNEKNTGMKIAAINALDMSKFKGQPSQNDLLSLLKDKVHSDENNYIRLRARAALKEVNQ